MQNQNKQIYWRKKNIKLSRAKWWKSLKVSGRSAGKHFVTCSEVTSFRYVAMRFWTCNWFWKLLNCCATEGSTPSHLQIPIRRPHKVKQTTKIFPPENRSQAPLCPYWFLPCCKIRWDGIKKPWMTSGQVFAVVWTQHLFFGSISTVIHLTEKAFEKICWESVTIYSLGEQSVPWPTPCETHGPLNPGINLKVLSRALNGVTQHRTSNLIVLDLRVWL